MVDIMKARFLFLALVTAGGCAHEKTLAESLADNDRLGQERNREQADYDRAHPDPDTVLPVPPPKTTFDLWSVAKTNTKQEPGSNCEKTQRWHGYVQQLGEEQRARVKRLRARNVGADGQDGWSQVKGFDPSKDPYWLIVSAYRDLRDATRAEAGTLLNLPPPGLDAADAEDRLRGTSIQDLEASAALMACSDGQAPSKLLAVIDARKKVAAEEARCAADPVCANRKKLDRIEYLRSYMCSDVAERESAKAGAQREIRDGKEIGVVDLRYLNDEKTRMQMADDRIAEVADEWKDLTGKPFSKKACSTKVVVKARQ